MFISEYTEIEKNGLKFLKAIRSDKLVEKKGYLLEFDDDIDMQLAIFRIKGELFCLSNICLHRHASEIYNGIIRDNTVTCPLHGWSYNYRTGENVNTKNGKACLKTYQIFEENNYIYIEKPEIKIPKWRDINYDYNEDN